MQDYWLGLMLPHPLKNYRIHPMSETEKGAGVTAPLGFKAGGFCCGFKSGQDDLAIIASDVPCESAAIFTQNIIKAEPVKLSMQRRHKVRAVIANSGNANACTGEQGRKNALRMSGALATALGIKEDEALVCSTGVIGQQMPEEAIKALEENMSEFCAALSVEGHEAARQAILTTDTVYKEGQVTTKIGGIPITIGAMAKGSGMIHVNMGTMLSFITTDCAISAEMLDAALRESADSTYNCISIDGDTSTNDTLVILANGLAGNAPITTKGSNYYSFLTALNILNEEMAKKIAADGEGASRLIECRVEGAATEEDAKKMAKAVVSSNLVKAAFFGRDANWGRVLCALGYSGAAFNSRGVSISFKSKNGEVDVCRAGVAILFDEDAASSVLSADEVIILVSLLDGRALGRAWGCDLTSEYVKINSEYRS